MGSQRLPGKVLADICGKPMLLRQVERIQMSRLIDEIIVCTSTSKKDDEIVNFCNSNNINFYRGPEDDVLKRVSDSLIDYNVDIHVEFFGDSPLPDYQLIDEIIGIYLKYNSEADFFSNAIKTTYPPGTEVVVYSAKTLLTVNKLVKSSDPLREHVGLNIKRFPDMFKIFNVDAPPWFNYPEIYLEVDTKNDLKLIRKIQAMRLFLKQSRNG